MKSKLGLYLTRLSRTMWARATAFSLFAIVSALLATVAAPYIPYGLSTTIGADAVDHVLSIIASSMLAVTTFSLGIAVSAYNSAASGATPRATKLLVEDATTQNVLSTFLGAFLFSLVGIIVLRTGAYGDQGRVILFLFTIIVIIAVVVTLLRWIGHLTHIGRMSDTLERVESATRWRTAWLLHTSDASRCRTAIVCRAAIIPSTHPASATSSTSTSVGRRIRPIASRGAMAAHRRTAPGPT